MNEENDYQTTGWDIQRAMVDLAKRFPNKANRPDYIYWAGHYVKTVDIWRIPRSGKITIRFVEWNSEVRQGFDVKLTGSIFLDNGEAVSHLRTWRDPQFENFVQYNYVDPNQLLKLWNVYERPWPNGNFTVEKWTGNAGFYVDLVSSNERIYHCSHGLCDPPNFESLVVQVKIYPNSVD